jgi:capsular polysaccharide biosynthesis protein
MIPIYTSSAKLYMINKEDGQITTLADLQIGSYLVQDYKILVKSRPVAEEVIKKLNLELSSGQLISLISVLAPEDSRVLQINVSYFDPQMAKTIVDTIAQVSSERMVSIMGMEQVNIIEEGAVPAYPSSPDIRHNTLLAGCGGFLIASVLVIIFALLNDSIKSSEDIEKYLGLTTLGFIPVETSTRKKKNRIKEKKKKAA